MEAKRNFDKVLVALVDDQEPLVARQVQALNNLMREQRDVLDAAWATIPLDKRHRLVATMAEMAEEEFRWNFGAAFRRGLRDEDAEVRRLSVGGLWEDTSLTLVRPFLTLLVQDPSPEVRAAAATALGRFVLAMEMEDLPADRLPEIVEALVGTVKQGELPLEVRRRAVEALGNSSDERVPAIIQRAYNDPAPAMQASAIFAMGRSADAHWSGIVRAELHNDDAALRFEAARAAGELGDRQAVNHLIRLVADGDTQIREVAIWSLGEVGGPTARKALQILAKGKDRTMRHLAQEALAELSLLDEQAPGFTLAANDLADDLGPDEDEALDDEDELDEDDEDELDEDDEDGLDDEDWDEDGDDLDDEDWEDDEDLDDEEAEPV